MRIKGRLATLSVMVLLAVLPPPASADKDNGFAVFSNPTAAVLVDKEPKSVALDPRALVLMNATVSRADSLGAR